MKNRSVTQIKTGAFFVAVLLNALTFSVQADPPELPPTNHRIVQQLNPDVRLIQFTNGLQVEQLTGAAAHAHLQNLIARHPEAFAASKAEMLRRGFQATTTVFVERTYR
jgi:hypothetical protein